VEIRRLLFYCTVNQRVHGEEREKEIKKGTESGSALHGFTSALPLSSQELREEKKHIAAAMILFSTGAFHIPRLEICGLLLHTQHIKIVGSDSAGLVAACDHYY
jgi:cysteine sulfinate desulfinase/cysteine desulfurase-like protein